MWKGFEQEICKIQNVKLGLGERPGEDPQVTKCLYTNKMCLGSNIELNEPNAMLTKFHYSYDSGHFWEDD